MALTQLGQALGAGAPFCVGAADPIDLDVDAGSFLTLTGGSTGAPKVIRRTQASWIASFEVNAELFAWQADTRVATLGALSHSLSLYAVAESLYLGLNMHALCDLSPGAQYATLARERIRVLYATPTQLRLLTKGAAKTALHDLRHILCGGGALDEATQAEILGCCPNATLHQFYGAAETSFVTLTDAQTPAGSVGRAYPGVEIDLRQGQVWVRSPYLFEGYACARATRPNDGFITAGELGRMDDNGYLWLLGRQNRQVQIADQSVSPEAVEQHIQAHFRVTGCAVIPVADGLRGTRLVAILNTQATSILAEEIQRHCRAAFGPLIAPRRVLFKTDWPLLPSGKTDLNALAKWAEAQT